MSLESLDYDPYNDLLEIFSDPKSINQLDSLLEYTNSYKVSIDQQIEQNEKEYREYLKQTSSKKFDASKVKSALDEVIKEINENKQLSINSQNVISSMTSNIKDLDDAKKNLVLSMTVLKRLQMLMIAYEQLSELIANKDYTGSIQLLNAVNELIDHFKSYKSIDEIAQLTKKINKLKISIVDQIFQDFETALHKRDSNLSEEDLRSCCGILDILGLEYHDRLNTWFCNQQLKEIKSIFISNDEAGSLDNLSRRFLFFKRVLKNFEQYYTNIFPESWNIEQELTIKFCEHTRESIKQILAQNSGKIDVDLLLNALQQTIDFEKYLNNKFHYSNNHEEDEDDEVIYRSTDSKFTKSISFAFEPFLNVWVENQNSFLNSKFLDFLSAPKLYHDESDQGDDVNIIHSSTELFRSYRHLLNQCSALSTGQPLYDLSKLFSKWGLEYSNKILKPILPMVNSQINNEAIVYIILTLNTADYCSITITQLEDKMIEMVDTEFKENINFDPVKDSFLKLINESINLLISKISHDSEFSWREFSNTDWNSLQEVGDQSRFVVSLKTILNENFSKILPKFSRDLYIRNLCDKTVEITINQFLINLIKIKPIAIIVAEQLLLDLSILKETFLRLPTLTNEGTISSQYSKHVDKTVNKLEIILKLLLAQDVPQDGLIGSYFYLIGDKSLENFSKFLELKGFDKSKKSKYLESFKLQLKNHSNHGDLIESSTILSKLNLDSQHPLPQLPTNTDTFVSKFKSPEIATSPKFDSFLKSNQIERNLKEFALNSEHNVTKLNENFKSNFGKFFNRNN
ncbi:hypothetical protein WICMUC_000676 [Wickerhamomyces mucosus]|uniref:Vps53 N-terminal domain-containing protein n=1 Tax=Wickerhamomyces mucosus TaxID=1378264 RepID=A0A9P8PWW7_9ASCO|nr:hypothetical protein WICMUC_000676 [Wickerhamomyces mucosus]